MWRIIILLGLLSIWSNSTYSQIIADFGPKDTTFILCTVAEVSFQDLSVGNPISWFWDFGDGTVSELPTPTNFYSSAGSYVVSLIVWNSQGESDTVTHQITVLNSFEIAAAAAVPSGCVPLTINFSSSITSLTGSPPVDWIWSFSDGSLETGQNPTKTFENANGCLNVRLIVEDSLGCIDSKDFPGIVCLEESNLDIIADIQDPTCDNEFDGAIQAFAPNGTPPFRYEWSTGDTTAYITNLPPGEYSVYIWDSTCSGFQSFQLESTALTIDFLEDTADCEVAGKGVRAVVNGGQPPYTYLWNNGDTNAYTPFLNYGIHDIRVTDVNGCEKNGMINLEKADSCFITVSGYVYLDDGDCIRATDEQGLHGFIRSGNSYVNTDNQGYYELRLPIQTSSFYLLPSRSRTDTLICPEGLVHSLNGRDTTLNFAFRRDDIRDFRISQTVTTIRPGFRHRYTFSAQHNGGNRESGSIIWKADSLVRVISAEPFPDSIDLENNVYVWKFSDWAPGSRMPISVYASIENTISLGTPITSEIRILPIEDDITLDNNINIREFPVRGSYDPNDKQVYPTGEGENGSITALPDWFTYTIRFQNTGTDTAFLVQIRDTISSHLDIWSYLPDTESHPHKISIEEDSILVFIFENILLPDSNTNEPASHGHVSFSLSPSSSELPLNTHIKNTAAIYFDFNAPIITNTVVNTLIGSTNLTQVLSEPFIDIFPNPAEERLQISMEKGLIQQIQLIDLNGRLLQHHKLLNQETYLMDVSDYPRGIYLIEIQSDLQIFRRRVLIR